MREITIDVYKFEELCEESQEEAVDISRLLLGKPDLLEEDIIALIKKYDYEFFENGDFFE